MYFKVTTARALIALLFLLSLSCSEKKDGEEFCNLSPELILDTEVIDEGNTALNAAALLGTSLELNENSKVPEVPRLYDVVYCSSPLTGYQIVPESDQCGIAAFRDCVSGESTLDRKDCSKGGFEMSEYRVHLEALNAPSLPYCPSDWDNFLGSKSSELVKHFDYFGNRSGSFVNATTSKDVVGWDANIRLSPTAGKKYGIKLSQSTNGTALKIHGARIQSDDNWDQTFSSENLTISQSPYNPMEYSVNSRSQEITVQENNWRYTAKIAVLALTWDFSSDGCGCIPTSGQLTTTYSGSRSGKEVITFHSGKANSSKLHCGFYELQEYAEDGTRKSKPKSGRLNYCL